jgi:hypothetical protein
MIYGNRLGQAALPHYELNSGSSDFEIEGIQDPKKSTTQAISRFGRVA